MQKITREQLIDKAVSLLSDGTVQTYEQLSLFDDRGKIVV